jgi:hypothetical protein
VNATTARLNGRGDPRRSFPNDFTAESLVLTAIARRIDFTAEDFFSTGGVASTAAGHKRK